MMIRSARFWLSLLAFQIVFGGAVFTLTRHYYRADGAPVAATRSAMPVPNPTWPDPVSGVNPALLQGLSAAPSLDDPIVLSRQADESFANKQYDRAADFYARLLALDPGNVETYNNLGITLHYVGRSAEALNKLNEGVALDPTHQRIWLTTGFVNAQLGRTEEARIALSNAVFMDPSSEVGQSAAKMLDSLPQ